MTERSPLQYGFLAGTTRAFAFIALVVASVLSQDSTTLVAAICIGCVWLAATAAERLPVPRLVTITVEAALVGTTCAIGLADNVQLLTALVFPPFTAAMRRGPRGLVASLSAEMISFVVISAIAYGGVAASTATGALMWTIFSLSLGLIGTFIYRASLSRPDPLDSYRNAQRLIRELIGLSGKLSQGLEPVTLAASIASRVHDELPVRGLVVHVSRGNLLTPIISDHGASEEEAAAVDELADHAWRQGAIQVDEHAFALPLTSEAGVVAVISGFLSRPRPRLPRAPPESGGARGAARARHRASRHGSPLRRVPRRRHGRGATAAGS